MIRCQICGRPAHRYIGCPRCDFALYLVAVGLALASAGTIAWLLPMVTL